MLARRVSTLLLTLIGMAANVGAADTIVFGPKTYDVPAKAKRQFDETIAMNGPCDTPRAVYTLTATQGAKPVKAAKISFNGAVVLDEKTFAGTIEKTIAVRPANLLRIELEGGTADGSLSVSIRRRIELTEPVLGEKTYSLTASKSDRFTESFSVADTAGAFALILRNGTAALRPVDDARVVLNGTEILSKKDIESRGNQDIPQILSRDVSLRAQNTLQLDLKSNKIPAGVTLQIVRRIADTRGPVIQLDSLPDGETETSSPLTITGKATDDSGVSSFSINGAPVPVDDAGAFRHTLTLVPGANALTFAATDCQGNATEQRITIIFASDATPPVLEVTLPPMEEVRFFSTAGGSREATIMGSVTDTDSGVRAVTCNGAPAVVDGGFWTCKVAVNAGANNVTAEATDMAGNSSRVTRTIIVTVDDIPPTIAVSLPQATAGGWLNDSPTLAFDCADNEAIRVCPPTRYVNDGVNLPISGTAVDAAGNRASVSITVNVDTMPPELSIDGGATRFLTNQAQFRIAGRAADETSGVASVRCGSVAATLAGDRFECLVPLAAGRQTVEIIALDRAENRQRQELILELDQTPPEILLDEPETTSVTTDAPEITLSGTVTDDDDVESLTVAGAAVAFDPDSDRFTARVPLTEGDQRIELRAVDRAGNVTDRVIDVRFVPRADLSITSPPDLAVLRGSTVNVTGTIGGSTLASLRVNGIAATISGSTFTAANIPLWQGRTVITAIGTTPGGQIATASVNVYRDSIPPRVIVEWPPAGSDVAASPTIVSGSVDDIVVGTINAGQLEVTVNGVPAVVSNRTFKASVSLTSGTNTLIVQATDQGGNTTTTAHTVRLAAPATSRILPIGGDDQSAAIGTELPATLRVRLVDAEGRPIAGQSVTFNVVQNNGTLAANGSSGRRVTVASDAQGEATARWILGTRAGVANQQVSVTSGDAAPARFFASGTTGPPALIVVDMGGNQFGIDGERLPRPLVVAVVDAGSNRVADVPVTFLAEGGGSFDGNPSVVVRTDSDGRAWVTPTLAPRSGFDHNVFRAFAAGVDDPAEFRASSAPAGPPIDTKISGVVLDNTNTPISGVTMRIEGTSIQTRTDASGQFTFTGAPIGYVRLIADGSTAERAGTWPTLEFAMYTNSGQDNTIGMPIYLLPIDVTRGIQVDEQRGGTIALPELPGFSLTIAPGSATFPGGLRTGTVSVTLVHNDKMPMVPGFGQQPRFLITIQPPGAHFDPPAALTLPNTDGLAPGEVIELYSFDHDLGQFVAIGTGSVSEDGSIVRSDPGVGIIKAGWHCGGNPAGTGSTGTILVDLTVEGDDDGGAAPSSRRKHTVASSDVAAQTTVTTTASLVDGTVLLTATGAPNGGVPPVGPSSYSWSIVSGSAKFVDQPSCSNAPTCVAKVQGTAPGDVVVRVTYTASGGSDTEDAKVPFEDLESEIASMSFDADLEIQKDVQSTWETAADPVWTLQKRDMTKIDPVAYIGNASGGQNTIQLRTVFKIDPAAKATFENVVIEGVATDNKGKKVGELKSKDKLTIQQGATEVNVESFDASKFELPVGAAHFNPLKFTWTFKQNKGKAPAGTSEVELFTTLAQPRVNMLFLSELRLAIAGERATTEAEALKTTWANFSNNGNGPKNVKSWDGREYVYYKAGGKYSDIPQNVPVEYLLTTSGKFGARCGVFQFLLIDALRINGLRPRRIAVDIRCDAGFCASSFLVNKWKFPDDDKPRFKDGDFPWLWITSDNTCNPNILTGSLTDCYFEMVPPPDPAANRYGDLFNEGGVDGQNSPTPSQKAFPDHAVVEILGRYFDASYGFEYTGAKDFQDKSIAGYLLFDPQYDPKFKYVRKPPKDGTVGVVFNPIGAQP